MNGVIKVIEKAAYVLSVLIGIVIANSCTIFDSRPPAAEKAQAVSEPEQEAAASGRQNPLDFSRCARKSTT